MNIFLASYNPLCSNEEGIIAIEKFDQKKFVDSSTRREPAFESEYPSISSLCRGGNFVPRIHEGDVVVYVTKKNKYIEGVNGKEIFLTGILKVIKSCESHQEADRWYKNRNIKTPNNCIVEGSEPLDTKFTGYRCLADQGYIERAHNWPVYHICEKIFLELTYPPVIDEKGLKEIFDGKIPNSLNPPKITQEQYEGLINLLESKLKRKII